MCLIKVMVQLYLNVDQEVWPRQQYSDQAGTALTGTIYDDELMTSAFDFTNYASDMTIRLYDHLGRVFSEDTRVTAVAAASGTWKFLVNIGEFDFDFIGEVEIELVHSSNAERLVAVGRNSSAKLRLR